LIFIWNKHNYTVITIIVYKLTWNVSISCNVILKKIKNTVMINGMIAVITNELFILNES